jgi:folate-binding protein YgfZ
MSGTIGEQVAWAKASALVVAAPERCVLEVTGADRLSWLNALLTCDLQSRKEGDAVQGLALAQKGKIVSDVVVLVRADRALVVVERATVDALTASFERHLMMEDAEVHRSDRDVWFVHGPRAREVLAAAQSEQAAGGVLDLTGFGGAVLATADASRTEGELARAARDAGGGVGDAAGWEAVRLLAGVPRFGVDFDESTYPQEAALESRAVSFGKGCYLGQDVVCMLDMRGRVNRRLVSLSLDTDAVPAPGAAITDDSGATVGQLTSAARVGDEVRGLAMVKHACVAKGTVVRVEGRPARVV